MTYDEINIGDTVAIREWNDMVAEYDVDVVGDIHIESEQIYFVREMRYLCGTEHVVIDLLELGNESVEVILEGVDTFSITPGMLEPVVVCRDEAVDVSIEDFMSILNG